MTWRTFSVSLLAGTSDCLCHCLKKTFSQQRDMSCPHQLNRSDVPEDCSKSHLLKHSELKESPPLSFKRKGLCGGITTRETSLYLASLHFRVHPPLIVFQSSCIVVFVLLAGPSPFDLPVALISLITVCYSSILSCNKSLFHLVCSIKFMNGMDPSSAKQQMDFRNWKYDRRK